MPAAARVSPAWTAASKAASHAPATSRRAVTASGSVMVMQAPVGRQGTGRQAVWDQRRTLAEALSTLVLTGGRSGLVRSHHRDRGHRAAYPADDVKRRDDQQELTDAAP